jgi:hypothetical protein
MATSRALTATTTPTALNIRADPNSTVGFGVKFTVPAGGQTVYVGGPDVGLPGSATEGDAVLPGSSSAFDLDPREQVFYVVASGTQRFIAFATGV